MVYVPIKVINTSNFERGLVGNTVIVVMLSMEAMGDQQLQAFPMPFQYPSEQSELTLTAKAQFISE